MKKSKRRETEIVRYFRSRSGAVGSLENGRRWAARAAHANANTQNCRQLDNGHLRAPAFTKIQVQGRADSDQQDVEQWPSFRRSASHR